MVVMKNMADMDAHFTEMHCNRKLFKQANGRLF